MNDADGYAAPKTTAQWLEAVLASPQALHRWLTRQYIGEMTAARRAARVLEAYPDLTPEARLVLTRIGADELKHALWVRALLVTRGLPVPDLAGAEDRYWKPVLADGVGAMPFDDLAAAGAHAEGMRLMRIRALAACEAIDADIRGVFTRILPDEEYHEQGFKSITTPEALAKMAPKHAEGLRLLGLET